MCVKVVDKMNKKLVEKYKKWYIELSEKEEVKNLKLLGDNYSNPYYIGVPEDWTDDALKIMVVGEEGNGFWGCGKHGSDGKPYYTYDNIKAIQDYNLKYVRIQRCESSSEGNTICDKFKKMKQECNGLYTYNSSSHFWQRIRKIQNEIQCEQNGKVSFVWNNMDKIHYIPQDNEKRKDCRLYDNEREALHSCPILKAEIDIIKPDIVIFCMNYWDALCAELEKIGEKVYSEEYTNDWDKYRIIHFKEKCDCRGENKEITFVFTQHPNWGNFQKEGKSKFGNYEDEVIKAVAEAAKKIKNKP